MIEEEKIIEIEFKRLFRFSMDGLKQLVGYLEPKYNEIYPKKKKGRKRVILSTKVSIFLVFVGHSID